MICRELFGFNREERTMSVLKNKTQGKFTMVSKVITTDQELSLEERGMLLTLLSLPDNWEFSIKGLSKILPDGICKISTVINKLLEKGYVERLQSRSKNGTFGTNDIEVYQSPVVKGAADPAANIPHADKPSAGNSFTDNPDTEKPDVDTNSQYITTQSDNQISNTNHVCRENTLPKQDYADLVSEFGKQLIDYQIDRINQGHYKGCLNYKTIKKWCMERQEKGIVPFPRINNKCNSFCNFLQREDYDIKELEERIVENRV